MPELRALLPPVQHLTVPGRMTVREVREVRALDTSHPLVRASTAFSVVQWV